MNFTYSEEMVTVEEVRLVCIELILVEKGRKSGERYIASDRIGCGTSELDNLWCCVPIIMACSHGTSA